jgi:hypothetical protein
LFGLCGILAQFANAGFEFFGKARVVFAGFSLTLALSRGERECALIPDPSPEGGRESPSPFGRGARGEGACDNLINIRLHPFLVAVDDLPIQALFGGHPFGGIFLLT